MAPHCPECKELLLKKDRRRGMGMGWGWGCGGDRSDLQQFGFAVTDRSRNQGLNLASRVMNSVLPEEQHD